MQLPFFKKKRVIDNKNKICPSCLDKMNFSFKANILVYNCEKCGLIWMDNEEIKRIIKLSKEDYINFSSNESFSQNQEINYKKQTA